MVLPEAYDTDGLEHFIPILKVTDKPCNEGEITPCYTKTSGLGSNAWSLDNDFRFYTEPGHIKAVELRDGTNHYNDEAEETLIGSGKLSVSQVEYCLAKMRRLHLLVHLMSSSVISITFGKHHPVKMGSSVSTCSYLLLTQVILTYDYASMICPDWLKMNPIRSHAYALQSTVQAQPLKPCC